MRDEAILLYTDDPGLGGVAQYNFSLLGPLKEEWERVHLAQGRNPRAERAAAGNGAEAHWLEAAPTGAEGLTFEREQAARLFEAMKPALILFSDCCPVSNLGAREAALAACIPFVCVVGFVAPYLVESGRMHLPMLARQYDAAREVVAVSQENLHLMHQAFALPAGKGRVIHYGRPEVFFKARDTAARFRIRKAWQVPPAATLCFTAARLEVIKGYQHQLDALRRLRDTPVWKNLYFAWAGGGTQEGTIREALARDRLAEHVRLVGDRDDIAACLDASDIFVMTSHFEGMPLAIMEAMAKGVPVIATGVSGVPEELRETGKVLPHPLLDEEGVVAGLAAGITAWAEKTGARLAAGNACRVRAGKMFREERMVRETMEMLMGAADRAR